MEMAMENKWQEFSLKVSDVNHLNKTGKGKYLVEGKNVYFEFEIPISQELCVELPCTVNEDKNAK